MSFNTFWEKYKDSFWSLAADLFLGMLGLIGIYIVLSRLWGGGFTGGDDGATASAAWLSGKSYWQASFNIASSQGRFYQLFIYPFAQIPYIGDSLKWFNICRIFSSGFAIFAFYFFSRVAFGKAVAYLSLFIYLGLFESIGGGYNPFHTLPFWFNTGMGWIFLSYSFFVIWLRVGSKLLIFISMASFVLGLLTYESMIFYAAGFPLLVILGHSKGQTKFVKSLSKGVVLRIAFWLPGFLVGLYLMAYLAFRYVYPSSYAGNSVAISSLLDLIQSVISLSLSGLHFSYAPIGKNVLLHTWDSRVFLFTSIVSIGALLSFFLKQKTEGLLSIRIFLLTLFGLAFFVFLPNILLSLTEKYRYLALHTSTPFYIGSYYSAFALALLAAYALLYFFQLPINRYILIAARLALAVILFPYLILTTYENNIASSQYFQLSKDEAIRWKFMERASNIIKNQYPEVKKICTDSLIEIPDPNNYWSYFFSKKIGRYVDLVYVKSMRPLDNCNAYIKYHRYDSYIEVGTVRTKLSP